jgi:hypothetical protein
MRIVAIDALLLLVGFVPRCQLQPRLLDLLMTRKTQLTADGVQELIMPSRMWSVAGKAAVVTLDGIVRILDSRTRVFVTREAKLAARICQQCRRFGGVRVMAFQTGPVRERLVLHVTRHEEIFEIVAIGAELTVLHGYFKNIIGVSRIVAGLAFTSEHWIMDARLQQGG